jgi:hypothetical protein
VFPRTPVERSRQVKPPVPFPRSPSEGRREEKWNGRAEPIRLGKLRGIAATAKADGGSPIVLSSGCKPARPERKSALVPTKKLVVSGCSRRFERAGARSGGLFQSGGPRVCRDRGALI